ncbi:MAG: hypothetical protein JW954_00460 [Dehalococcoidaceae bacterium]|nr:hypothetical protein [Dehalococcoidaceae bacterium]
MAVFEVDGPADETGLRRFLEVAKRVYQNNPVWVPESENAVIEGFQDGQPGGAATRLLTAMEGDLPVARCALIIHPRAMDEDGNPQGWLCFFEALEGYRNAGQAVINECEKILKATGVKSVLGPRADNLLLGLLSAGFDLPQTVLSTYNPPYYLEIFENCGYRIREKMGSFLFTHHLAPVPEIKLPGFTTRHFDRANLEREAAIFNRLQNSTFGGGSYVSRTPDEDRRVIDRFLPFLDDELVIIAEDKAGSAVGLLICLPDIYQAFKGRPITRARIISIGVTAGWANKGVGAMMASRLGTNLLRKGYRELEASWILSANLPPQNLAKRFRGTPGREFVLLEKKL